MAIQRFLIAMVVLCAPVLAQTDAIAVTVSRNVDLPPDAVYISMAVATESDVSLEQVLQATRTLGFTAANLSSVNLQQYGPSPTQTRLAYAFELSVPFSQLKETNDKLAAARRTMAADTPPMELQVYAMTVTSGEAGKEQARQRLLSPLFEDARIRADQLAKAAGVTLGGVIGVTEAWLPNISGPPFYGPGGPIGPAALKTAFSLNVRYALK
jgi:uncharacterized protein YggE